MIKALLLSTLLYGGENDILPIYTLYEMRNENNDLIPEARRRGGKGNKKRRRGGNGLR